jgi:hypothetical protein
VADGDAEGLVAWGRAMRCRPGQSTAADMAVVERVGDTVIVAAVDGCGHGPEAVRAARIAVEVLSGSDGADVTVLAERCHRALGASRGAALSIATLSAPTRTMTWVAVGNVEGRLLRAGSPGRPPVVALRLPGGVAGHQLPRLRAVTLPLRTGDVLVLATDGIRPAFADRIVVSGTPQTIADRIVDEYWNAMDDAVALVVRYRGVTP